jgi:hypothetical protein
MAPGKKIAKAAQKINIRAVNASPTLMMSF